MNITQIEEALTLPATAERCRRVLDEVQPVLRQWLDSFKHKYAPQARELLDFHVQTYEQTLKTTMYDGNPKNAKENTDIGKRAYVGLLDKKYDQTGFGVLNLELNGMEKKLKMVLPTNFYPLWEAVRTQSSTREFTELLDKLPDELQIQVDDKDMSFIPKAGWVSYLQAVAAKKQQQRRPWFYIGVFLAFDAIPGHDELIDLIWDTWTKLQPLREYIDREAALHAFSLDVLRQLNEHEDSIALTLYGKSYEVKLEPVYAKSSRNRRQSFGLYEKGQLLAEGRFDQYLREPHEVLGVFINGHGHLYVNLRDLGSEPVYEWYMTKSFRFQKADNAAYRTQALEALAAHGYLVKNHSFYVGTYLRKQGEFAEPVADVKKTLIAAALLFAEATRMLTLPKADVALNAEAGADSQQQEEAELAEELFLHDFNLSSILANIGESDLTYSPSIIRDFHLNLVSLEDKHFVILNGISGTGKTKLCLLYANAVYGKPLDAVNPYLRVIPVRPDWTDSTALFGYYSALEQRYVRTPFLDALLQAIQEGKPMFIVLDEMNLARVEYYLSDYLSAIESRQPIRLHTEPHVMDIPQELYLPNNLYVIGTINVDETTHSISDKVLDRAFVMTLSDVDLDGYWSGVGEKYKLSLQEEWELLQEVHGMLRKDDLHFGYRTLNEMLRKLYVNAQLDQDIRMEATEAVDRVIAEKVLPKIRGDERIGTLLASLIDWASARFGAQSESLRHLTRMKGELDRYGAAQFWR
ncbi:hypothetical protein WBG83_07660 [Paenibacillus sp. y28]